MSNFGNISVLRQELQEKLNALPERQNAVQTRVYNELKENDPSRFVEIYFTQEPEKKVQADSMYIECRCTYIEPLLFQLDFINNKLPRCDCREKSFHEVGFLFKNREEFDGFYSMDEPSFKKEVSKRQALKKDLREFESALRNSKPVNLKKGLYSEKQEVKTVISRMAYHKQNCYYEEAVWILFMYNAGLYKEWEKNGRYFKNKIEMYEAYIGEEYSSILKAKKKE